MRKSNKLLQARVKITNSKFMFYVCKEISFRNEHSLNYDSESNNRRRQPTLILAWKTEQNSFILDNTTLHIKNEASPLFNFIAI